ncbi:MAG: hypothetical protein IPG20_22445 [Gammaproteobacteria bacterium]|nr:hypothetical protein [Gammaproteobacteria bacterium]
MAIGLDVDFLAPGRLNLSAFSLEDPTDLLALQSDSVLLLTLGFKSLVVGTSALTFENVTLGDVNGVEREHCRRPAAASPRCPGTATLSPRHPGAARWRRVDRPSHAIGKTNLETARQHIRNAQLLRNGADQTAFPRTPKGQASNWR